MIIAMPPAVLPKRSGDAGVRLGELLVPRIDGESTENHENILRSWRNHGKFMKKTWKTYGNKRTNGELIRIDCSETGIFDAMFNRLLYIFMQMNGIFLGFTGVSFRASATVVRSFTLQFYRRLKHVETAGRIAVTYPLVI